MPAGLEQFDTMFSVRETPWHGLGAVLDEYPDSIEDALDKSGLGWKVDQHPVYAAMPMAPAYPWQPPVASATPSGLYVPQLESSMVELDDYRVNTRQDTGEALGIVSDSYTVVQNEDAFRFLDSLILSDLHFETAGSIRNGRRVWVLARRPDYVEVGGDETATFIYIANSHDGTMSVTAAVTPIRIVCQNTLGMALSGSANRSYKFRHVGDLQEKFDEARRVMDLTINYEAMFKAEGDRLAGEFFGEWQFDANVVKPLLGLDKPDDLTDRQKGNREQNRAMLLSLFNGRGPDGDTTGNSPRTKWCALNAVGEFSDHYRRSTARTNQIARSFEDADLKQRGLALIEAA